MKRHACMSFHDGKKIKRSEKNLQNRSHLITVHMDDTAFSRSEYKYLMNDAEAAGIRGRIGKLLLPDAHSGPDGYQVRSLYFDTPDNRDYEMKMAGVDHRQKIRLRVYSPKDEWCSLEAKRKSGDLGEKTVLRLTRADARLLMQGDFTVLLDYAGRSKAAVRFYTELTLGCMRPAAMIEYTRQAYVYPEWNTRVTFDSHILCSESDFDLFRDHPGFSPVLVGQTVLEVKFNRHLMKFIRDTLVPHRLTRLSVSKYCVGRPIYYL